MLAEKKTFLAVCLIFLASVAAYGNSLTGEFMFEDQAYVLSSEFRPPVSQLWQAFSSLPSQNFYRPLVRVYDTLAFEAFGYQHSYYRLCNFFQLVVHNILIFFVFFRVTRHYGVCLTAAVLNTVHPIYAYDVNYIAVPILPYSIFFYLSLLFFLRSYEKPGGMGSLIISCMAFMGSFMIHEVALCLPAYVFLIVWQLKGDSFKRAVRCAVPYAAIVAGYFVVRMLLIMNSQAVIGFMTGGDENGGIDALAFASRFIQMIALYTGKLLYPRDLLWMWSYDVGAAVSRWWLAAGGAAVAGLVLAYRTRWRQRHSLFFILWYLLGFTLLGPAAFAHPASGVKIQPHWFVFSSVGLLAFMTSLFFAARMPVIRKAGMGLLVIYAVFFLQGTRYNNTLWRTEKRYMQHWLKIAPRDHLPNFWLASIYWREGRLAEAETYFERALTDNFIDWEVYYNLGIIRQQQGDYDAAIDYYKKAHRRHPRSGEVLNNLATVYMQLGNYLKAKEILGHALEREGNIEKVKENLVEVESRLNRSP